MAVNDEQKKGEKMPHPSLWTCYSALCSDHSAHYRMDAHSSSFSTRKGWEGGERGG